jgi:hypothetical protein
MVHADLQLLASLLIRIMTVLCCWHAYCFQPAGVYVRETFRTEKSQHQLPHMNLQDQAQQRNNIILWGRWR